MDAGQLGAQPLGDRPLVRGLEVGEEQADRDRLGAGSRDRGDERSQLVVGERLDHAVRADPLGGAEAQLRRRPAAPASARRGGRGCGRFWRPISSRSVKPCGRDQRRARAALLEQRVGADGHPVGEALDLAGRGAGALERRLDRGEHAPRLVVGRRRRLRGVQRAAVDRAPRR